MTTAAGWQTLTFDFANQAAGTAALNLAYTYTKASIFFDFGVTGATAGRRPILRRRGVRAFYNTFGRKPADDADEAPSDDRKPASGLRPDHSRASLAAQPAGVDDGT